MKDSNGGNTISGYQTNVDYLEDVLALISLRLQREVLIQRSLRGDQRQEAFLGLFLSDEDVDAILNELRGFHPPGEDQTPLDEQIVNLSDHITSRAQQTEKTLLPQRLASYFGLNNNEVDLLLYLLASEVDDRIGRVYGYLHDDVARKRLSPGLAFRLMRETAGPMPAFRRLFSSTSPLGFYRLITVGDQQERYRQPLMERPLRMEDRLTDFLLGDNSFDSALFGYAVLQAPDPVAIKMMSESDRQYAATLAQRCLSEADIFVLEGGRNSDTELWTKGIAVYMGVPVLEVDWCQLAHFDKQRRLELLTIAQREARLRPALLCLRRAEEVGVEDLAEFNRVLIGPVCITSNKTRAWNEMGFDAQVLSLPNTGLETRSKLWADTLGSIHRQGMLKNEDIHTLSEHLAERYPLSTHELMEVEQGMVAFRLMPHSGLNEEQQITQVCKRMLGRAMDGVAQLVETPFIFSDLVLQAAPLNLLREILLQQQHGLKVMTEWKLGELFHQVQGCRALFTGPSGTGKTMAASVIANELGLELYRIDLAQVVSKYIGETEKNLDRVFDAASRARVVLFIDEADALFGKRSEVKDAHDRYANIETSFLLQKMEEYNGVMILATNLSQNMDDAFFRRIDTIVEFLIPQENDRLRLWQRLHSSKAPLADDIDLTMLARNFELSGGHIKNCILTAAFYAADEQGSVTTTHLVRAIGREYMKIGKPISKSAFGEFYSDIRKIYAAC